MFHMSASVCLKKNNNNTNGLYKHHMMLIPVIVSVRSWLWVFLSNLIRAGTPSQFLMAILFSWSRPYEMFFSAPQAEWCTSLLGWSSSDTKDGMPFRRRTSDLT